MKLDFWFENTLKDVHAITCSFSDLDRIYRGNMIDKHGKMIGDYSTKDSTEIEKHFKFFKFN